MKGILLAILLIFIAGCSTDILPNNHSNEHLEEDEEHHIHADFKVFINNKEIDFSLPPYQLRDKSVHIEDGIGEEIHVHKKGITIGDFFETLGIKFNETCIIIDDAYCKTSDKELVFYVNDVKNYEFGNYEIRDVDRILVSYGKGDIGKQLESVTSLAKER